MHQTLYTFFRNFFSSLSSRFYIVPVVISAVVWNIPRFMELETCFINTTEAGLTSTRPAVCPTELRLSLSYTRDYILLANFVVMTLLPFLLLSVFNFLLFRTIRASGRVNQKSTSRQRRDQKIAAILILLVTVFGSCNFVRIITNVYEVNNSIVSSSSRGSRDIFPSLYFYSYVKRYILILNFFKL